MNGLLSKISIFLYNSIIFIINNFNIFLQKFIDNIISLRNQPYVDFFDRLCYNCIILFYNLLKLIRIFFNDIITICKIKLINLKFHIQNRILGNDKFLLSLPNQYFFALLSIPNNSKILDFNCYAGLHYNLDVIDLINSKNLKIDGFDNDNSALDFFENKLRKFQLNKQINLFSGDIFTMKFEKYDYVIFTNSVSNISTTDLTPQIKHIKDNFLTDNGKIIFINNIIDNPQTIVKILKPKLKYITTIDFGKTLTAKHFNNIAELCNTNVNYEFIDKMSLENIAKFFNLHILYKLFSKFGLHNYDVNQYKIILDKEKKI